MTGATVQREPPNAREAEIGLLGCLILDAPRAVDVVRKHGLTASSFYDPQHALLASAVLRMHAGGEAVDLLTINARLRDDGVLDRVGGDAYLRRLVDQTPTVEHAPHYAATVAEFARRRALVAGMQAAIEQADSGASSEVLFEYLADVQSSACRSRAASSSSVVKLGDLVPPSADDPNELLCHRFICRGGILMWTGPTGIGKSSAVAQAACCWSVGRDFFGIAPARPLRILIVQAENDDGDMAEIRDGVFAGLRETVGLTDAEEAAARESILLVHENSAVGDCLAGLLRGLLDVHRPDLLVLDPAFAFIEGDAYASKDVSVFLRRVLNPILSEYQCGCVVVHHTIKPPREQGRSGWTDSDFAYSSAGPAEWANAPRAVVVMRSIGSPSVFELRLGKRGKRAGWRDADGRALYARYIAHGEHGIFWRAAQPDEIPAESERYGNSRRSRRKPPEAFAEQAVGFVLGGPVTKTVFLSKLRTLDGVTRDLAVAILAHMTEGDTPRLSVCERAFPRALFVGLPGEISKLRGELQNPSLPGIGKQEAAER